MNDIRQQVGQQIRRYRQASHITLEELAATICKSKSTLSKYESGSVSIDIETLADLALALNITPNELLHYEAVESDKPCSGAYSHQDFLYYYDGRSHRISRSVLEYYETDDDNIQSVSFFYDLPDLAMTGKCRTLYLGKVYRHSFVYNYTFVNQSNPIEHVYIHSVDSLDLPRRQQGMLSGVSYDSLSPVSMKVFLFPVPQQETPQLLHDLLFTQEDLRLAKRHNMLVLR